MEMKHHNEQNFLRRDTRAKSRSILTAPLLALALHLLFSAIPGGSSQEANAVTPPPEIISATHPLAPMPGDQFLSTTRTAELSWIPSVPDYTVTNYYYVFDSNPVTTPTTADTVATTDSISLGPLLCGPYWFHLIQKDTYGEISLPAHYPINVIPTTITLANVSEDYSVPYLVDFTFSLRDFDDHAVIIPTDWIEYLCSENGAAISQSETARFLVSGETAFGGVTQTKIYLVLDYTISMFQSIGAIEAMEAGALSIIDAMDETVQFGIYEFHREDMAPQRVCELTSNKDYVKSRLAIIQEQFVQDFPAATRCWDAVNAAVLEFASPKPAGDTPYVIFLGDGVDESSASAPGGIIGNANNRDVRIYVIGYGNELLTGEPDLQNIANSTNGQYYLAADPQGLKDSFAEIAYDLRGQYTIRWATLKRATDFDPSFEISISESAPGTNVAYTSYSATLYSPPDWAGDVLQGLLRLSGSPVVQGETDLYLRAHYIPRYITEIRLYLETLQPYPFIPELIPEDQGGLPADWTLTTETIPGQAGAWINISSPDPDDPLTSLEYAWFGPMLKIHFSGVPSLDAIFTTATLTADNSIYLHGQTFNIGFDHDPEPALSVDPEIGFDSEGMFGGPFTPWFQIYNVSNSGTTTLRWTASASASWLSVSRNIGVIQGGDPPTSITAYVNTLADTLPRGQYTGQIRITNNSNGLGNVIFDVTLNVLESYPLVIQITTSTATGVITVDPDQPLYLWGTTVTLTATPDPSNLFTSWTLGVPPGQEYENPTVITIEGMTTVSAAYVSSLNSVVIEVEPDIAAWSITDANEQIHQGIGDTMLLDMPPGNVILVWEEVPGYFSPIENPVIRTLVPDGTLTIEGIYQLAPKQPASPSPAAAATSVSVPIKLDWADAQDADFYDLYLWPGAEAKPLAPTAAGLTNSEYDPPTDLEHGTSYTWQVTARNTVGENPADEWQFITRLRDGPTTYPTNVQASDEQYTTRVRLTWDAAPGATHYRVYRAPTLNATPNKLGNGWTNNTNFNDNTALPKITYTYWVKAATDDHGNNASPFSDPDTGAVMDYTPMDAPISLTASHGEFTDRIEIAWTTATLATHYQLLRAVDDPSTASSVALTPWLGPTSRTYTDTNVIAGASYYYWVRSAFGNTGFRASLWTTKDTGWVATPAPANLDATYKTHIDRVALSWTPIASATPHYQVLRSASPSTATAAVVTAWRTDAFYDDFTALEGLTYFYWVRAAVNANGDQASALSDSDYGARPSAAELLTYKITYKSCALELLGGNDIAITFTGAKSSIKIKRLPRPPKNTTAKAGTAYIVCPFISTMTIDGYMGKLFSDCQILTLESNGAIKSLTTKNSHIETLQAAEIGTLRMAGQRNPQAVPAGYALTSIVSPGTGVMRASLTGVIVESLDSAQSLKSFKTSTKKYKNTVTGDTGVSLAGIGRVSPEAQAEYPAGEYNFICGNIQNLSVKGGPIAPDLLRTLGSIGSISARSSKINGVLYNGQVGNLTAPARMYFLAASMKNIFGTVGVSGIFIAGYEFRSTAAFSPTYFGTIKRISMKRGGVMAGEVHVTPLEKPPAIKPSSGTMKIITEDKTP